MWIFPIIVFIINFIRFFTDNYKKIKGIFIFNGIWLLVLMLSILNIYHIDNVDLYTYFIIVCGIFFFNLGNFLYLKKINTYKIFKVIKLKIKYKKLFFLYEIFSLGINLNFLLKTIPKIKQYGYWYVKGANYGIEGFDPLMASTKIQMLYELAITVTGDAVGYILVLNYFYNKNKKNLFLLMLFFINKIIVVIFTGGKSPIIWLGLFILLFLLYYNKFKIKYIKYFITLCIIFSFSLYFSNMPIIKSLVIYATGSIVVFDKFINSAVEFWYGKMFIAPFEYPITISLRFLSKNFSPIISNYSILRSGYTYIGGGVNYNALYTFFDTSYLDFGIFGVIVYSSLVGMFYKFCTVNFYNDPIKRLIIIHLDILLFYSILKNHFIYFNHLFLIVIIYILSKYCLLKAE